MNKETQDLLWSVLLKKDRESIGVFCGTPSKIEFTRGYKKAFDSIFGHHNLTSDTEPEEMLMVERKKVQEEYQTYKEIIRWSNDGGEGFKDRIRGKEIIKVLDYLFGDKCLPDSTVAENATVGKDEADVVVAKNATTKELNEDNFAKSELEHQLEQTSVQAVSKSQFKVGQPVRVLAERAFGRIERIETYDEYDNTYRLEYLPDFWFEPAELEPCTEESRNLSLETVNCDKPEDSPLKKNIQLSFHVDILPSSEEFYIGVGPQTDAYIVNLPDTLIPPALLKIIRECDSNQKRIIGIAIVR